MSQSGVSPTPECVDEFNKLKLNREHKYIIFKVSDDKKSIVVEDASAEKDWEVFSGKLRDAGGPRYAVYDVEYSLSSGEGTRNKITFIAWSPDDAGIRPKMLYASSKDALKSSLNGIGAEIQANDEDDIEWSSVVGKVSKGLAG
ncbi:cofilin [Zalerion maritima]|uniref:Cofilin n=1 Tax=Zalerion maritima TaxID=339359 RepID=A0AAD5RR69_9PEZI|nr:cofilin [Zalerion maritima]